MGWQNSNPMRDLPPAPKYSIPKIRKEQNQHLDWLLGDKAAFGEVFQGKLLEDLRRRILRKIPDYREDETSEADRERIVSAIDSFLFPLIGQLITDAFAEELSLRLIEWIPKFESAEHYSLWDQCSPIWALVYVIDIERRLAQEGRHYMCRFQAIAGPAAGITWDTHMTGGQIQHLLREIGLPKYKKFKDHEIGGMYILAYLRPDNQRINIGEVSATASILAHNRQLFKKRQQPCCSGFWNGICINCPWGRKDCELARHEHRYEEKIICSNYRIVNGKREQHRGFKIRRNQGVCLDCLNHGHIRPEAIEAYYRTKNKRFKEGISMLRRHK